LISFALQIGEGHNFEDLLTFGCYLRIVATQFFVGAAIRIDR